MPGIVPCISRYSLQMLSLDLLSRDRRAPAVCCRSMFASMGTTLITGASAGLGIEFARLAAAEREDLVLVARRRDPMATLAAELSTRYGIRVTIIEADLRTHQGVRHVVDTVVRDGIAVETLINNAGYGLYGNFSQRDAEGQLGIVDVNVRALTMLTQALLPGMLQRRRGRIMLVGSLGGFLPGPYLAVYYASKAYVLSFGEALSEELRGSGVTVSVLAPGPTATEFHGVAGLGNSRVSVVTPMMTAAEVARIGYNGMKADRVVVIPGAVNKVSALLIKLMPRAMVRRVIGVLQARRT